MHKNVKLGIAGAVFFLAVVVFWVRSGSTVELPNTLSFICVETGEQYSLTLEQVRTLPATNPDTQTRTLLPIIQKKDGTYVDDHYASALEMIRERNKYVDLETLRVQTRN